MLRMGRKHKGGIYSVLSLSQYVVTRVVSETSIFGGDYLFQSEELLAQPLASIPTYRRLISLLLPTWACRESLSVTHIPVYANSSFCLFTVGLHRKNSLIFFLFVAVVSPSGKRIKRQYPQ